jgi:hypothetical protein
LLVCYQDHPPLNKEDVNAEEAVNLVKDANPANPVNPVNPVKDANPVDLADIKLFAGYIK